MGSDSLARGEQPNLTTTHRSRASLLCQKGVSWSQLENICFRSAAAIAPPENDGMLPRASLPRGRRRVQGKQLQSLQGTVKRKGFHIVITIL